MQCHEKDYRPEHLELIRIHEEKIRDLLGSMEHVIENHKKIRALDWKEAQSIFSDEDVARLLVIKSELLELLKDATRASENGLRETAENVEESLRSLQRRFGLAINEASGLLYRNLMGGPMSETRFGVPYGRLQRLSRLKNFAIVRGASISDETIRDIGELEDRILFNGKPDGTWTKDDLIKLDLLIRVISEATYPITIDNVDNLLDKGGSYYWVHLFLWVGVAAAVLSGIMMYAINAKLEPKKVWEVMAAILLGIVGAVIYVMLPNGKINIVAGLDEETKLTNIARIIIGGIMGYVIYLITSDAVFSSLSSTNNTAKNALGLLYPLVGGYSISLVVGVLSKAVTAVELTLGLDEKKNVGALRK